MVGGYEDLKHDLLAASDAVLALAGIEKPTVQQRLGAMLDAEFKLRVITFLTKA
jgi:hypothetical protein